jgi:hypothetical protein
MLRIASVLLCALAAVSAYGAGGSHSGRLRLTSVRTWTRFGPSDARLSARHNFSALRMAPSTSLAIPEIRPASPIEQMHNCFVDLGLRTMEPAGEAILDAICGNATAKRKELDDDYQRIANVARIQGQNVNPAILPGRAKQYQQIVAGVLSELQGQLSTDARLQLQEFLKSLPLHEYVPKAPNSFLIETPAAVRIHP